MTDKQIQTGGTLFEAFVEQIKQALEHLYDFAYLQQHSLARVYDGTNGLSARTAGQQLRYELVNAIETLKPMRESHFRAPDARLYNILHLIYVESLTIQETAVELGLSERQAYRDLKRGQESVAGVLWEKYSVPTASVSVTQDGSLPQANHPLQDDFSLQFSLQSEIERLRIRFSPVDIVSVFQHAQNAVSRLAEQQQVTISTPTLPDSLILSSDPALAHQALVSLLSYAIQQTIPGILNATLDGRADAVVLTLRYHSRPNAAPLYASAASQLAHRLRWKIAESTATPLQHIELTMTSTSTTVLVIDDNEGWVSLIERFLDGLDCVVASITDAQVDPDRIADMMPDVIILDVMMPDRDGWEILQRLRAQPATAHLPIVICTVFSDEQLALSLGASAFLSKPTDREHVLQTLHGLNVI